MNLKIALAYIGQDLFLVLNNTNSDEIVTALANSVQLGPRGVFPLHNLYRYVLLHLEGFLRLFVWKRTGIHFAHFGLESGIVFGGTMGLYERLYRFNSKWARKKNMRIRNGFEEFFVWSSFVVFLYIAYNF